MAVTFARPSEHVSSAHGDSVEDVYRAHELYKRYRRKPFFTKQYQYQFAGICRSRMFS